EHMAAYDPLTGMINRRRMAEVAADELDHSFEKHSALSMILADIDHFKLINDRYGHQFGDQALLHVSQTIMQIARDGDSCCRWGGEEFLIMLPVTDLQGARQLAERIRVEVSRNALCLNGHDVGLTLTLGVVELQPHEGLDSAIARADEALYAGKDNGRNQVMLGQPAAQ
ncbi:MAG: GGDEF domain-containing protein, partial [Pseudomonas marincola]|uniref:GGDEF domain-containing protein n=2 Tax=Pseudomonas TaxID=286 RepID=UPI003002871C